MSEEKKYKIQNFEPITPDKLLERVRNLKDDGYRFLQLCGITKSDHYQLLYSFDLDHVMLILRMDVKPDEEVESITKEYWPAFIYENEVHDLFGIKFLHNALDYGGNFFTTAEPTPWAIK